MGGGQSRELACACVSVFIHKHDAGSLPMSRCLLVLKPFLAAALGPTGDPQHPTVGMLVPYQCRSWCSSVLRKSCTFPILLGHAA